MKNAISKATPVACRIQPTAAVRPVQKSEWDHAGARITLGNRGPLHRAAKRATRK